MKSVHGVLGPVPNTHVTRPVLKYNLGSNSVFIPEILGLGPWGNLGPIFIPCLE